VAGTASLTGLPGLRAARESKRKTQVRLAAESGISRTTISDLETGARNAQFQTLQQLADALGVDPESLRTLPKGHPARAQPARPNRPLLAVRAGRALRGGTARPRAVMQTEVAEEA
jgi:transcriptional regulator with XRE-family HTH domain